LGSAFNQAQPALNAASATLNAALPGAAERAFGANPTLDAATSYNNNVLGGKYLDQGNPHLEAQIGATNNSIRDRVGAQFSAAGRTGSGANQYALGRALAENETGLRFTDYNNERGRMSAASSLAPSLDSGRNAALASYLQAAEAAAGLQMSAAQRYAGGIGSLVGGYNTTTSTQTPSLGMMLAQAAGNVASAWAGGGFK
jgi:hypothetical protein